MSNEIYNNEKISKSYYSRSNFTHVAYKVLVLFLSPVVSVSLLIAILVTIFNWFSPFTWANNLWANFINSWVSNY